ncbi:MAG: PspC domain-containing protein [Chitinophagaceae bacterium]
MKKVININFQGRVIPIEESAYEMLKEYTNSLRKYFANEEGREEIINDIENRIAELFMEDLKKNPGGCITDDVVEKIVASMGRPEEFDGDGTEASAEKKSAAYESDIPEPKASLYRNANDKVLGGVCSGIANQLKIDPTIVRVLFALITFGGFGAGFLLYIVLWIVLPQRGIKATDRKRLYRNPDTKVFGGVAGGLASYFNVAVWIPRIIFALPLIISLFNSIVSHSFFFMHVPSFPNVVFNGFGGTLTLIYIILWIVVPEAKTASEKLEMRGEKIDLESIKNSVQEELQGVKGRAQKFGQEFKEKAKDLGSDISNAGKDVADRGRALNDELRPVTKKAGSGLAHVIGVLFKVFFLFIASIFVFAMIIALGAILFVAFGAYDVKDFILEGSLDNILVLNTIVLFIAIPVIAAVVWFIRRLVGYRSKNHYMGYIFGSLWLVGLVSMIWLAFNISRDFKRMESVKEKVDLINPANGRLLVNIDPVEGKYYDLEWIENDSDDSGIKFNSKEDSMLLNTVRVLAVPSKDSSYHATITKYARGNDGIAAEATAQKFQFPIQQNDSILHIPAGFVISKNDHFRNQRVVLLIEVPVGKMIKVAREVNSYGWFSVNGGRNGLNVEIEDDWSDESNWYKLSGKWCVMTEHGLVKTEKDSPDDADKLDDGDDVRVEIDENGMKFYKKNSDSKEEQEIEINTKDSAVNIKLKANLDGKNNGKKNVMANGKIDGQMNGKMNSKMEGVEMEGSSGLSKKVNVYTRSMISVLDLLRN